MRHTYGKIFMNGPGELAIGDFCSIAIGVRACSFGHHPEWVTTFPFSAPEYAGQWGAEDIKGQPKTWDITIGHDVWIGQDALIMANVGHGAIVGARAVVRDDVPPYAIVTGNPAQVVRMRFTPTQIDALLKIAWWAWPDQKIHENVHLFCSKNIDEFIHKFSGDL